MSYFPCNICGGGVPGTPCTCRQRDYGQFLVPQPRGCICPPTSEQTCQSPTCPRQDHTKRAAFGEGGGDG